MLRRPTLFLIIALPACAGTARGPALHLSPLQPTRHLDSDDDLEEGLNEYAALPLQDAARASYRDTLLEVLDRRVDRALSLGSSDAAFDLFERGLQLWDPSELANGAVRSSLLDDMAHGVVRAFAKQGQDFETLTGLAVLVSLHPADPSFAARFDEAAQWSDDAFTAEHGPALRGSRLFVVASRIDRDWPSPFVRDRALGWFTIREKALRAAFAGGGLPRDFLQDLGDEARVRQDYALARLYLRGRDLAGAASALDGLTGDPLASDPGLRSDVEAAAAKDAPSTAFVKLAHRFDDDRDVALDVCLMATERLPKDREPYECAAALAYGLGRSALAARLFEQAESVSAGDADDIRSLVALYGQRLQELETTSDMERVDSQLVRLLEIAREATVRYPEASLDPSPATAYVYAAHAHLNIGDVDGARRLLDQSIALDPTLDALEQRGLLEEQTGAPREAVADFERAARLDKPKPELQQFQAARMLREEGDAYAEAGDPQRATVAYRMALADWEQLFGIHLTDDAAAEGFYERGRLLYALGDLGAALAAFDRARASKPGRIQTYVDEISFLVPRGHLDDAVDIYHKALAQRALGDYLRAYLSFWVIDLARVLGRRPDDLALSSLESLDGVTWYDDLARYHAGTESEADLESRAVTPGQRAELYFYESLARGADGDIAGARALWQKALGTRTFGNIELEMAEYYLLHGLPKGGGQKIVRPPGSAAPATPGNEPPAEAHTDGTI